MKEKGHMALTAPMTEWSFIGQKTLVGFGKFASNCKFIKPCGFEQMERISLSNPHSS